MAVTTVIRLTHNKALAALGNAAPIFRATDACHSRDVCLALAALFERLAAGLEQGVLDIKPGGTAAVAAWGTLTIASGSGAVGGTIAGSAKTVTWATSDTASAAALKAAINADATLNKLVVATSALGVVTITALAPGLIGNQLTLVASGTGVTAGHLASGKMTGGTGDDVASVSLSRG
ncbi:MAG: hypothetical protein JXA90_09015 [Planctomycetes bacterium]|nr:hypothetical protein [Planctomycetota bacterium]